MNAGTSPCHQHCLQVRTKTQESVNAAQKCLWQNGTTHVFRIQFLLTAIMSLAETSEARKARLIALRKKKAGEIEEETEYDSSLLYSFIHSMLHYQGRFSSTCCCQKQKL